MKPTDVFIAVVIAATCMATYSLYQQRANFPGVAERIESKLPVKCCVVDRQTAAPLTAFEYYVFPSNFAAFYTRNRIEWIPVHSASGEFEVHPDKLSRNAVLVVKADDYSATGYLRPKSGDYLMFEMGKLEAALPSTSYLHPNR